MRWGEDGSGQREADVALPFRSDAGRPWWLAAKEMRGKEGGWLRERDGRKKLDGGGRDGGEREREEGWVAAGHE